MTLMEKLQKIDSKRRIEFVAIDELDKPKEIKQFFKEYIIWLRKNSHEEEVKKEPKRIAYKNLAYCLTLIDGDTYEKWNNILDNNLSHPYFSKEVPFDKGAEVHRTIIENLSIQSLN